MSEIRKAVLFSVLNQYSLQVIGFISVAVLARLLTPEQIGLFSVATAIAFLAIEIRSFGVSEFLVREKTVDRQQIMSVLGVMIIMSWGLALILIGAAGWIADFYGEPDLRNVLWIITLPFFLAPYSSVPVALLAREMKFDTILKIDLFGAVVRNLVSISLVLLDYGYYGLAYGALAGVVAEFLANTYYRPANVPWLPSFRNLRPVFRSGAQIGVSNLLESLSQNANDLVLGRLASMKDVGFFSRGMGLVLFLHNSLIQAVGPVALPHLAQVRRAGGSVQDAYLNAIVLVGAFTLPVFAVVNLAAQPMIRALFGDQWAVSVQVASVLALWEMLRSVHCFATPALLTVGKERLVLIKELVSFTTKIVAIVLMVPHGLVAVAWGLVCAGALDFLLVTLLVKVALDVSPIRLLQVFLPNLLVAAACWTVLKVMTLLIDFEQMNPWLALLIIGSAMVPVWLVGLQLGNNRAWPFVRGVMGKLSSFLL
ncbi:MAG TPA: lipopolysaccharide biosynthesis protein [Dongiaceae bacterium]|nr:lipopolysaccharide biosynthesis protein [Dongiaceae bacterium]